MVLRCSQHRKHVQADRVRGGVADEAHIATVCDDRGHVAQDRPDGRAAWVEDSSVGGHGGSATVGVDV